MLAADAFAAFAAAYALEVVVISSGGTGAALAGTDDSFTVGAMMVSPGGWRFHSRRHTLAGGCLRSRFRCSWEHSWVQIISVLVVLGVGLLISHLFRSESSADKGRKLPVVAEHHLCCTLHSLLVGLRVGLKLEISDSA